MQYLGLSDFVKANPVPAAGFFVFFQDKNTKRNMYGTEVNKTGRGASLA